MINDVNNLGSIIEINAEERDLRLVGLPNEENEFVYAKTFLQKSSTDTGANLYDHLSEVLNKILSERPENVVDFFEEYSRKIKEKRFKPLTDHLEDIYVEPGRYRQANRLMPLLKPLPPEEPSTLDPEDLERADMTKNNMLDLLSYFELAGLGLPRTEMFCLTMSMRQLIRVEPIAKIRFWGKIFGMNKNYIIVETELKDEEYSKRNENYNPLPDSKIEDIVGDQLETITKAQLAGEGEPPKLWEVLPPVPQTQYEEPPEPPSEPSGVGANKNIYYVCNETGEPWVQLPDVTPKQIRVARQIYKTFTGDLDQPIVSYPFFPGSERNLLRAQIARISAGTHISPLGFYTFGGEGMGEGGEADEEEEEGNKGEIKENPKYDPVPIKDLTDRSMMFWVHHNHHILNQGRTTWWNPNPLPETGLDEELGEEEEEAKPVVMGPEPETGPPLLTPCSEDVTLDAIPAWSVRSSSGVAEEFAVAIVRSNFWPGAYSFATQGKMFHNVYFGSGLKTMVPNFSPMPLPPVEQDYPMGPEIMEIVDPTGAEEEAWRIAHLPKEKPPKLVGEEEMPEEEEEEEDEDEDEDE
ncbi:radial spoke head protein 6 homolog A [Tribolium castaneum]|uniref:radial spoke head protein 6 homolog A n=1 Tax=Tribolium castaneum TaxID=7070 RepID=UPI0030FE14E7